MKIGNIIAIAIMPLLAACSSATNMTGMSTAYALNDERWVGVFIPQQSPSVDSITANRTEDQYGMPLWRAYESGRVAGAQSNGIHLFLQDGDRTQTLYRGPVSGHYKMPIPQRLVGFNTKLCVQVPWAIITHQRVAAGDGIACEAGAAAYFAQGRGRSEADAFGVIAIKPSGV